MEKNKQTNKKPQGNWDFYLWIVSIVFFGSLLVLLLLVIHNNAIEIVFEQGRFEGMNNAESNCLKLICEKANCGSIKDVQDVHSYCKSLVYGTDFYLRYK